MGAEAKAFNLHCALRDLLAAHKELIRDTNSEPTFGEAEAVTSAERALFDNRPMAAWETTLTFAQAASEVPK
jgi:hypothetical protein